MPSASAQAITRRTYNRPLTNDLWPTRFETWPETVERVRHHMETQYRIAAGSDCLTNRQQNELSEVAQLMLRREALPAGRVLWLGGTEQIYKTPVAAFNCAYKTARTPEDFRSCFWTLLNGCGQGFRVEPGPRLGTFPNLHEFEVIPSNNPPAHRGSESTHVSFKDQTLRIRFGDSAKGWAHAIYEIMAAPRNAYTAATRVVLDLSDIRGPGGRLSGYGWICSGTTTLKPALEAIMRILQTGKGAPLSIIDGHHILNWLGTVLSTRRSAEIALLDADSPHAHEFAALKSDMDETGQYHLGQSNNSLNFYRMPSDAELDMWLDIMFEGNRGEPGLRNQASIETIHPWARGTNPCFEASQPIMLADGSIRTAGDLARSGMLINVIDGDGKVVATRFEHTGFADKFVRVEFSDGTYWIVTPTHRFQTPDGLVEAQNLSVGTKMPQPDLSNLKLAKSPNLRVEASALSDALYYLIAFALSDIEAANDDDEDCTKRFAIANEKIFDGLRRVVNYINAVTGPLIKLEEITENGQTVVINVVFSEVNPKILWRVLPSPRHLIFVLLQLLLPTDRSVSSVYVAATTKDDLRIISMAAAICGLRFSVAHREGAGHIHVESVDFDAPDPYALASGIRNRARPITPVTVASVETLELNSRRPVFCCKIESTGTFALHNVVSSNCAEIMLPDGGFCNLVEVNADRLRDRKKLEYAVYLMARANYRQTFVNLNDGVLTDDWHINQETLRLCGVGLTGISSRPDLGFRELTSLRAMARVGMDRMADETGCPRSAAGTTLKPSGTLSKIMDCASGIHDPLAEHIINRVVFVKTDPVFSTLVRAGYAVEENPYDPSGHSALVLLPQSYPGARIETDPVVMLNRYKLYMMGWAEHNVSCSIYYTDPTDNPARHASERARIKQWIKENWAIMWGVSFFPRRTPDAKYLPQTAVTKAEFDRYTSTLKPVDIDGSHGGITYDIESDCAGGACPIR